MYMHFTMYLILRLYRGYLFDITNIYCVITSLMCEVRVRYKPKNVGKNKKAVV